MKVIKLQFENEHGKYKFYMKEEEILEILEHRSLSSGYIDAKSGEAYIPKEKIMQALEITPPKEQ